MRNKTECTLCDNKHCFVKQYSTGECLNKLFPDINQNRYKKGEFIFREGDPIFGIHFIQKGGVKVISSDVNGREQVVRLATDGHILGFKGLGSNKYYFNAIALKDSTVCFIENNLFQENCRQNPDLAFNLLLFFAAMLRRTELHIKYHAQMNIREKVAYAFIYINEVFGINASTKELNIELSRQDIADLAGTTPEQVSRQLHDFENEKIIARKKRTIQILKLDGFTNIVKDYAFEKYTDGK